ncbi:MAG: hypothetical protein A3F10_00095 [Coxiella sp. RIFCSPHIGHO2_12_FULL_42_15]|nr:MAG: hypothetical protein A3F10_00095 [Coxiella sp. RIFCSPHIGHO2_12_FULL_42_15]
MKSYSANLLNYFFHLDHVGIIDAGNGVYCIEEGSPEQGNVIKLAVMQTDHKLYLARFQCYGNVTLLAACEYICRWLEGKTVLEASHLTAEQILKALQLSRLHIHIAVRLVDLVKKVIAEIQMQ